jgi:hypothetical protein
MQYPKHLFPDILWSSSLSFQFLRAFSMDVDGVVAIAAGTEGVRLIVYAIRENATQRTYLSVD